MSIAGSADGRGAQRRGTEGDGDTAAAPGDGDTAAAPGDAAAQLARVEKALADRFPHRMVPDLERMRDLVDLLGQPQHSYPSIHLTGTNGKTSAARMVDSLLRAFGIRPGRYTSPHLESVTERISLDGHPAGAEAFARAYDDVAPYLAMVDARHAEQVTFFEVLTAMAFAAFADAPVDVAVVEVGMGGGWDATNVVDAGVAVVLPVALDHAVLGETLAQVAAEKAGIIRPDAVVVLAQQQLPAAEVLVRKAAEVGASVAREGLEFGILARDVAVGGQAVTLKGLGGTYEDLYIPLHGRHQAQNAACALAAVEAFLGGGRDRLDIDTVRAGFAQAASPGRLEVVRRSPTVVLDGAHNVAGAQALVEALGEAFAFDVLVGVVGVMADKDATGILATLEPVLGQIVVTQMSSPRAMPVDELAALAVDVFGPDRVEVAPRLDDAIDAGVRLAEEDTPGPGAGVIVTGSLGTVGQARRMFRPSRPEPAAPPA